MPVDPCGMAMGDVRACNIEPMRFPGVGLVYVRWYFTDKDYLPYPHIYGPWRWIRDDESDHDFDDGGPGGVKTFPWTFTSGVAPRGLKCSGPKGTEGAWMGQDNGERFHVGGYWPDGEERWDFLTMGG